MLTALALLALVLPLRAPQTPAPEPQMMTYQMVIFRAGPNAASPTPADQQKMLDGHLAHLAKLNRERVNLLYGPFTDAGDMRGIAILDVKDGATATAHFKDDPFVKGGFMVVEAKPWYGPKGWFSVPNDPPVPEPLIWGFLMRGPNTSLPAAEAAEIQKGHLSYMDSLHAQGKLVMAGPFGDNSAYRGVVVYRVASVDDAKKLAADDPAVKAGRLVIEARPWMTFKGILK